MATLFNNLALSLNGLITDVNNLKSKTTINLFDVKWSDHELNNTSWLRSDTFSWQNGNLYNTAYNELLNEYNNRSDTTTYKAFVKSNYTAVGSNINEWRGIVQGFNSNTDYITHPVVQPTTNMEYVIKCHASVLTTNQYLLGQDSTYKYGPIFYVANASTGQLNYYLSTNGSSWNVASNVNTNCTLPANTWKWFKFIWNGSTFTISESIDGINYAQKYSVACTAAPKFNTNNTHILGCYNGNTSYAFTTGKFDLHGCYFKANGTTVWKGVDYLDYAITDKKYRIVLPNQNDNLQKIYDDYGAAWYYVLDSANKRFKLPRTKFGFTGLRDGVGEFVEAGLPNIEGTVTITYNSPYISTVSGPFTRSNQGVKLYGNTSGSGGQGFSFDASKADLTYGNSTTVQPPATEMYLYHYVGEIDKASSLSTIGVTSENINSTHFLNTPVGTIIWSMANTIPSGYLLCNGQTVSRSAYPELFQAISIKYGAGDGSTTFNLPNLIGKFIEGSATAGIEHEAGLPNIEGKASGASYGFVTANMSNNNKVTGAFSVTKNTAASFSGSGSDETVTLNFDASKSNSIYGNSNTVQPPSMTAMPCIKAFDVSINQGTVDVAKLVSEIETIKALSVRLDGSNISQTVASLRNTIFKWFLPDFSREVIITSGVVVSTEGSYTVPDNGYICVTGWITSTANVYVKINGIAVINQTGASSYTNSGDGMFPVTINDVITYFNSYGAYLPTRKLSFVPLKG